MCLSKLFRIPWRCAFTFRHSSGFYKTFHTEPAVLRTIKHRNKSAGEFAAENKIGALSSLRQKPIKARDRRATGDKGALVLTKSRIRDPLKPIPRIVLIRGGNAPFFSLQWAAPAPLPPRECICKGKTNFARYLPALLSRRSQIADR